MHLLVVEDDRSLADLLRRGLTQERHVVDVAHDGTEGLVRDRRSHEVTRAGRPLDLSPKEYALLEYLMRHPGQVLSRTLILERVWDYGFDSFANVVDATIRRLRKAVDEGFEQPLIHTVRGVGYKIKAP